MAVSVEDRSALAESPLARAWWLFLVTGIAWVLVAFVVLTVDPGSAATIGYLTAFFLFFAGVNELVSLAYVDDWKWLRVVFGVTFLITGLMALAAPFQTFGVLALLIGWYLLFKGILDIILSVAGRGALPLWGLLLASGIFEAIIGVWAIGSPLRSAWLLVLWVGIGAVLRGISEIVLAFKLRGVRHEIA